MRKNTTMSCYFPVEKRHPICGDRRLDRQQAQAQPDWRRTLLVLYEETWENGSARSGWNVVQRSQRRVGWTMGDNIGSTDWRNKTVAVPVGTPHFQQAESPQRLAWISAHQVST